MERAWAAEPGLDRADRRVRLWKRGRVCRLTDREGGVGWVGAVAAEVDRNVVAWLKGGLRTGGSLVGADV